MAGCSVDQAVAGVYPARPRGPSLQTPWFSSRVATALAATLLLGSCPHAISAEDVAPPPLPPPENAQRLDPNQPIWVDKAKPRVYVDGRVVLREGVLEMFACPAGTKEHEAVVAVDAKAYLIHAALLRVGAEPGTPAQFDPVYKPPTGTTIEVGVEWLADGQRKSARAQDWVRNVNTQQAMKLPFVFAGSGFWTDPDTGTQRYLAEAGDLVCVSNFGAAMLDVPAPSTQANGELWFEPFTERIPEVGTPVRVVFEPKPDAKQAAATAPDLLQALATLRAAQVGEGSSPARQAAWEAVAGASPEKLPTVLAAMKDASPLAENWLRTAADAIVDRADRLPATELVDFVRDTSNAPRARRTAYEIVCRIEPVLGTALLDVSFDDPSPEIRYDAVARLLDKADAAEEDRKPYFYRRAMRYARSLDQVEAAGKGLEELGEKVSLAEQLGFVTAWSLTGPFDNREGIGFDAVYPPEEKLNADASYEGQDQDGPQGPFGWKSFETDHRLGEVQLNDALARHKGAVAYAWATVTAGESEPIEVRYTSNCATKVWLNGELIAEHETYHSGSPFDQYLAEGALKKGVNQLLVKVCQNEQTQGWAETWPLQLRLTGPGAAPLEDVSTRPGAESP